MATNSKTITSSYFLKTTGNCGLKLPCFETSTWDNEMGENWDSIDTELKENAVATDNLALFAQALKSDDVGFVNALTNGGFDIWQRGDRFLVQKASSLPTTYTAGIWTADMWKAHITTNTEPVHVSRSAITGGLSVSTQAPVGKQTGVFLVQKVESYKPYTGKHVTFSVNVKIDRDGSAGPPVVELYIFDGNETATKKVTPITDSTWTRVTLVKKMLSGTQAGDTTTELTARIHITELSTGTVVSFGHAMLAVGNLTDAVFTYSPQGAELRRCKRYYENWSLPSDQSYSVGNSRVSSGKIVSKRTFPNDILIHTLRYCPKYSIPTVTSSVHNSRVTAVFDPSNPGFSLGYTIPSNSMDVKLTYSASINQNVRFSIHKIELESNL